MNGYIALAQVSFKDDVQAYGIEKGILNFELLAKALINHNPTCDYVKMFDNRLDLQGVWYNES